MLPSSFGESLWGHSPTDSPTSGSLEIFSPSTLPFASCKLPFFLWLPKMLNYSSNIFSLGNADRTTQVLELLPVPHRMICCFISLTGKQTICSDETSMSANKLLPIDKGLWNLWAWTVLPWRRYWTPLAVLEHFSLWMSCTQIVHKSPSPPKEWWFLVPPQLMEKTNQNWFQTHLPSHVAE